jgi:hypothetical protein
MSDDPMAVCCRKLANSQHIIETKNAEIAALKEAIRRLADQDATLSVCDGTVTVTLDTTLTNEEREAVKMAALYMYCPILRDLSERLQVQQDFSSSAPVSGSGKPAVAGNTQPTFTDEEREAIEWFRKPLTRLTQSHNREKYKDTLRKLLERLNHDAVPEAIANADGEPAPKCGGEAGLSSREGTGNTPSKAEIDALEFVVEEGRIGNYGILRSWLIRLRPEWESQSYEESDEKRVNTNTNRDTTRGEGSVRDEGTVGERLVGRPSITQAMLADNERLRAAPPTWQEEVASVEAAFERSGVKPTWPADEAGNIGPMAAAMADEIIRLKKRFALSGNAENVDWKDIAETGRAHADNLIGEPGISELMHKMADEIELLRGYRDAAESDAAIAHLLVVKSRLTDAEREAVAYAVSELDHWTHGSEVIEIANTLRKLLERLGGDR